MADLSALIKLHKHELDQKQIVLARLYAAVAELERERAEIKARLQSEKEAAKQSIDLHFLLPDFMKGAKVRLEKLAHREAELEEQIVRAKDDMMETFSELKKYEMTQEARERLEAQERKLKEGKLLDETALELFRRKEE